MKRSGWGCYPVIDAQILAPSHLRAWPGKYASFVARGMGRSYGDSALADTLLETTYLDHVIEFDPQSGLLRCEAGVSLADILQIVVPKGWFLSVTPGTKHVSVGGAIAADVHGKNHHVMGCFSECVQSLDLLLPSGEIKPCSREVNADLFHSTCGGMGLTGIVLSASMQLIPVTSSYVQQCTFKTTHLEETLQLLQEHHDATYSVAWVDCLAKGESLGRSHVMLGEHAQDGDLLLKGHQKFSVPVNAPSFCVNRFSMKAFNLGYYHRLRAEEQQSRVHYEPYFYPLDVIGDWNRLYGKGGFVQYQCVIPMEAAVMGMTAVMSAIAQSQKGSFLSVLKIMGEQNDNLLSFPLKGLTLALDFKMESGVLALLDALDDIVLDHGGRVYLAKDARMTEQTFKRSYPGWERMAEVRDTYGVSAHVNSHQSQRLGF